LMIGPNKRCSSSQLCIFFELFENRYAARMRNGVVGKIGRKSPINPRTIEINPRVRKINFLVFLDKVIIQTF